MIQLTENVWAVEIPEGASSVELYGSGTFTDEIRWAKIYIINNQPKVKTEKALIPPAQWEYIFKTNTATDLDAEKIIKPQYFVHAEEVPCYPDYTHEWAGFVDQPLKSLKSLLKSKGLEGNYALLRKL